MALARKMERYGQMTAGSAAYALPEADRAPRPAPRPAPAPVKQSKGGRRALFVGVVSWAFVMLFSMALIQRNALVLEETRAITHAREELAQLQGENEAYTKRLETAVSVQRVQEWADARGMSRPDAVKRLSDATMEAVVAPKADLVESLAVAPEPTGGLWSSVKSYLAHLSGGVAPSAKKGR